MIPMYCGGECVGNIVKDVYTTSRDSRIHFYRKGLGYPISASIIGKLQSYGIEKIRIKERTLKYGTRLWEATVTQYAQGQFLEEPPYDKQLCVPLSQLKLIYGQENF